MNYRLMWFIILSLAFGWLRVFGTWLLLFIRIILRIKALLMILTKDKKKFFNKLKVM